MGRKDSRITTNGQGKPFGPNGLPGQMLVFTKDKGLITKDWPRFTTHDGSMGRTEYLPTYLPIDFMP